MIHDTILAVHIGMGTLGVLSGTAALLFRKGSPAHRAAGTVFVLAMLLMAASASVLATLKSQPGLATGGIMTIYYIATAWVAGRRKDHEIGIFEIGALIAAIALSVALGYAAYAVLAGATKAPNPIFPYVLCGITGTMALAAASDLSVILRRGLSGAQRVARHLWRMCFGLFISVGSFAAQGARVLPPDTRLPLLLVSMVLVLAVLFFWLVRVLFTGWFVRTETRTA